MKTVLYLDHNNVKHYTVIQNIAELLLLRMRFDYVYELTEIKCIY